MRITVTRTGGFAGLTRRATLETSGRPDAAELAALARSAVAEGASERSMGVPDGFQYEIELEDSTDSTDSTRGTGHCADPRLTEAQSALVRTVLKEGS